MPTNKRNKANLTGRQLLDDILQRTWSELLANRNSVDGFDNYLPAKLGDWLADVWSTQLETLRQTNKTDYIQKKFGITIAFKLLIEQTIGMDYFMEQMHDVGRMQAMDKLVNDLIGKHKKENDMKRELR